MARGECGDRSGAATSAAAPLRRSERLRLKQQGGAAGANRETAVKAAKRARTRAPSQNKLKPSAEGDCGLPVELFVKIMALLVSPRDVFALARTCRAARTASWQPGAFPYVSLTYFTDYLPQHQPVIDVDAPAPSVRPTSAATHFALFLARTGAAAGVLTLEVLHSGDVDQEVESAALVGLFRACSSLTRLQLDVRDICRSEGADAALLAALRQLTAPVQHARLKLRHALALPPGTLARLRTLRLFSPLADLSSEDQDFAWQKEQTSKVLGATQQLTHLEIRCHSNGDDTEVLHISSTSITSLTLFGKNACLGACDLPHLTEYDGTNVAADEEPGLRNGIALLLGCPLIDWSHLPPTPAAAADEEEVEATIQAIEEYLTQHARTPAQVQRAAELRAGGLRAAARWLGALEVSRAVAGGKLVAQPAGFSGALFRGEMFFN